MLEGAAELARTEPGRERILHLAEESSWAKSPETARLLQSETKEIFGFLDRSALWGPLSALLDPEAWFESLDRGGVLELSDLVELRRWMQAIEAWEEFPKDDLRSSPLFARAVTGLPTLRAAIRPLDRAILPTGDLSESASSLYGRLLQEISALRNQISREMERLTKHFSDEGLLQEEFTDVREGKHVLPVKVSLQAKVEGVVIDSSGSKQTVFIEPREIQPLSNRLRIARSELQEEVFRILKELCDGLRPEAPGLRAAVEELTRWDAIQARARWGRSYGGKAIDVSLSREFRLTDSAHPLLWLSLPEDRIQRNNFELEAPARVLLITGPNTGGKTVFLKTLGLAAIAARTGFPFPGSDPIRVPFFPAIFVDVGDPQSISEHLSSFSGHIAKLRAILEGAGKESLVLIDELGTATDPEEGSALSRAFLDELLTRGSDSRDAPVVVATSHDPAMKGLALEDPRYLNASMAFDEASLSPTYRMVFGTAGRSRAIEVAERLGLPARVIEKARTYLTEGHARMEGLLARLEGEANAAKRAKNEAEAYREEAEKLRDEWTKRAEISVAELLEKMRSRLKGVITSAEDEIRLSVKKIEGMRSIQEGFKKAETLRQRLAIETSSAVQSLEKAIEEEARETLPGFQLPERASEPVFPDLSVGDLVKVPKWKNYGKVLEVREDGKMKVALGDPRDANLRPITMMLSPAEVELLGEEERARVQPKPTRVKTDLGDSGVPLTGEINLRGLRFEIAMKQLEKDLERAYLGGAHEIRIVHGLGTGALKQGSLLLLSRLPYVERHRDGGPGEGGSGCTVVVFSSR